jgi:TatD DNase family protein
MNQLPEFFYTVDVHTHVPAPQAIVNVTPFGNGNPFMSGCEYYSIGIHPWLADKATPAAIARLQTLASDPRVVAIGEAGLDARRGPELDTQLPIFRLQAELAHALNKPLIVHAVATFPQIIQLKRNIRPSAPWIIHGFRGKPQLALELLHHDFYLSLGSHFNPNTLAIIPPDRLLHETDRTD